MRRRPVAFEPPEVAAKHVGRERALQMSSLGEMQELRKRFEALGVRFDEITNHEVLWSA